MSLLGLKNYLNQKNTQDVSQNEIQDSSKTTNSFNLELKDYLNKNTKQDFSIVESNADSLMEEEINTSLQNGESKYFEDIKYTEDTEQIEETREVKEVEIEKPKSLVDSTDYSFAQINDKVWDGLSQDTFNRPVKDLSGEENIKLMANIAYNKKLNPQGFNAWTAFENDNYKEAYDEIINNGFDSFVKRYKVPRGPLELIQSEFGEDAPIAAAIVQAESGFNENAINQNVPKKQPEESKENSTVVYDTLKGQVSSSLGQDVSIENIKENFSEYGQYEVDEKDSLNVDIKVKKDGTLELSAKDKFKEMFSKPPKELQDAFPVLFKQESAADRIKFLQDNNYLEKNKKLIITDYIRASIAERFGVSPNNIDSIPEEKKEIALGVASNIITNILSAPFYTLEMLESPVRNILSTQNNPIEQTLKETGVLVKDLGVFFGHQIANVSMFVSPFATEEQRKQASLELYNDPMGPIFALVGGKVAVKKSIKKIKDAPKRVQEAVTNLQAALPYHKSGTKAPTKDIQQYVDIMDDNPNAVNVAEQLSLDLQTASKSVTKKTKKPSDDAKKVDVEIIEEPSVKKPKPKPKPKKYSNLTDDMSNALVSIEKALKEAKTKKEYDALQKEFVDIVTSGKYYEPGGTTNKQNNAFLDIANDLLIGLKKSRWGKEEKTKAPKVKPKKYPDLTDDMSNALVSFEEKLKKVKTKKEYNDLTNEFIKSNAYEPGGATKLNKKFGEIAEALFVKYEPKAKPKVTPKVDSKAKKPKPEVSIEKRISSLNEKGFENLSTNEKVYLSKLKAVKESKDKQKEKVSASKEDIKQRKREIGRIEYKIKELETSLIEQADFLDADNVKSRTREINNLRKTVKDLDKDLNNTIELQGGFGGFSKIFKKKHIENVSENFLVWMKETNKKGELVENNQLKIFDYTDKAVHDNKFKSFMSSVDNWFNIRPYPSNLRGVKDVDKYYETRNRFFGKGHVAEMYTHEIIKSWKQYTPKELTQMYDVLNGTKKIDIIKNAKLRKETKVVRNIIDELGQNLVDRNLLNKETFQKLKGEYIARIYDVYLGSSVELTTYGRPSLTRKYSKPRKNLTLDERKAFSEQKTPELPFSETVSRSLSDVFANDFMQSILDNKDWSAPGTVIKLKNGKKYGEGYLRELKNRTGSFIAAEKKKGNKVNKETQSLYDEITDALNKYDESTPNIDNKRFVRADGYGILDGAFVDKGILKDFDVMLNKNSFKDKGLGGKIATFLTNAFKVKNVALNPPTIMRNAISAGQQTFISGPGIKNVPNSTLKFINGMKDKDYMEAANAGLFNKTFTKGELEFAVNWSKQLSSDLKNNVSFSNCVYNIYNKTLAKGKKAAGNAIGFYGKIDDVFKFAVYLDRRSKGKSVSTSTRLAQEALFDYSLVSPRVQKIREYIPFTTYFTKVGPWMLKQAKNNPVRTSLVTGGPIAYEYFGVAEKTLKEKGTTDADWERYEQTNFKNLESGSFLTLPTKDANGNFQTLNFAHMQPHGAYLQIGAKLSDIYYGYDENQGLTSSYNIENIYNSLLNAGDETLSNYSANPLPTLYFAFKTGVVPTRNGSYNLYSPLDSKATKVFKYAAFVADMLFIPPSIGGGDLGLVGEYLNMDSQSIRKSKRTDAQIISSAMGMNIYPVDINKDYLNKFNKYKREFNKIERAENFEQNKIMEDVNLSNDEKETKIKEITNKALERKLELIDSNFGKETEKTFKARLDSTKTSEAFEKMVEEAKKIQD